MKTSEEPESNPSASSDRSTDIIVIGGVLLLVATLFVALSMPGGALRSRPSRADLDRIQRRESIREFALLYHWYFDEHGYSPSSASDLQDYTPSSPYIDERDFDRAPQTFAAIERGEFIVVWNAAIASQAEDNSDCVLAYEASAAESGGFVLHGDGAVIEMTAEEFNAMPLIGTRER